LWRNGGSIGVSAAHRSGPVCDSAHVTRGAAGRPCAFAPWRRNPIPPPAGGQLSRDGRSPPPSAALPARDRRLTSAARSFRAST
jgi:hypothetical protein